MNKIGEARKEAGLTVTQLAGLIKVTEKTMRRFEAVNSVDELKLEYIKRISNALNKPLNFFIL